MNGAAKAGLIWESFDEVGTKNEKKKTKKRTEGNVSAMVFVQRHALLAENENRLQTADGETEIPGKRTVLIRSAGCALITPPTPVTLFSRGQIMMPVNVTNTDRNSLLLIGKRDGKFPGVDQIELK